jgi:hypothetical protein
MRIEKRTLNWFPRASLYDEAETARLKRKESAQSYLSQQSSNASLLSSITSSSASGNVELTMKIAVARVQAAVAAKYKKA